MAGATKFGSWAALAGGLLLAAVGCGDSAAPQPTTQFRPVDDDETPAKSTGDPKPTKPVKGTLPPLDSPEQPGTAKPTRSGNKPADNPRPKGGGDNAEDPALAGPTAGKVQRLRKMLTTEPPGETPEEKQKNSFRQLPEILKTVKDILDDKRAPTEARDEALMVKFQIATLMLKYNLDKNAKDFMLESATDLQQSSNPKLAMLARLQLFQIHVAETLQLQPRDGKAVLAALKTLLESGVDLEMVKLQIMPIAGQLEQLGYVKEGVEAMKIVGDHFATSKDVDEAIYGKQMQIGALIGKVRDSDENAKEAGDEILAKAQEIVGLTGDDPKGLQALRPFARGQEGDAPEIAGRLYDLIEEKFAASSDPKAAERAQTLVAAGRQRLKLVGQPLTVTGMLIEGDTFDWSTYQGKVVLIHFWAITNDDGLNSVIMQDMSNVARLQQKFHEGGLEIVGVNLNKDTARVDQLFGQMRGDQKLPWPTVIGIKSTEKGFNIPVAKACGLTPDAIPYTVLVGKDGKIAAASLQGPLLDEAIIKALAVEEPASPEKPAEEKPKAEGEPIEKPGDKKQPDEPK